MDLLMQAVLLIAGFLLLIKGADWFVEGSAKIADKMGIPQLVIGLTIVAMGTSAPEAAVSISAAFAPGGADIAIGNILGSNILNIFLILGITAVISTIAVQKSTLKYEIPFVLGITVLLGGLGYFDGSVSLLDGVILWAFMILYLVYLFRMAKLGKAEVEEIESDSDDKVWKLLIYIVIGMACIIFGSDLTVDAATGIARTFGMSERLIGLTLVALGTSLPELITSVTAAMKGKSDIAVGNIVGSNIFNILFVIGTTSLITTVPYVSAFGTDTLFAMAACVILWLACIKNKKLSRSGGIVLLLCLAVYMVQLIAFA